MSQTAKDFLRQTGQGILDALTGRVYLRDWQHAAKTFLPGGQGNAGKVKFTFHTYFSINEQAYSPPTGENYVRHEGRLYYYDSSGDVIDLGAAAEKKARQKNKK